MRVKGKRIGPVTKSVGYESGTVTFLIYIMLCLKMF
jgi:hypothetical protein